MKTSEKILTKADNLRTMGNMMGKAGYGMRLAANLGYKVGYNVAKHPNLERVKKQINRHPKTSLLTLAGIGIGIVGLLAYIMRED